MEFKSLNDGGLIVQQSPLECHPGRHGFQTRRGHPPGRGIPHPAGHAAELEDLLFGWQVEQGVTSNSVLYVKDGCTVGIGTGEQDRVGVAEIAIYKAYTKYADALCFKKLGKAYKDLELEIEQGKADKHLKKKSTPRPRPTRAASSARP